MCPGPVVLEELSQCLLEPGPGCSCVFICAAVCAAVPTFSEDSRRVEHTGRNNLGGPASRPTSLFSCCHTGHNLTLSPFALVLTAATSCHVLRPSWASGPLDPSLVPQIPLKVFPSPYTSLCDPQTHFRLKKYQTTTREDTV